MKPNPSFFARLGVGTGVLVVSFFLGGCATMELDLPASGSVYAGKSPAPQLAVNGAEAWKMAEAVVSKTPGADMVIGRGDSMEPLYRDRTVLIIKKLASDNWQPGMTVVFIGDSGAPVAHTLVRKAKGGWIAAGVGNHGPDDTRVNESNYIGTAFAAISPAETPTEMLAAMRNAQPADSVAVATTSHGTASAMGDYP